MTNTINNYLPMKRLYYLALVVLANLFFYSCEKEKDNESEKGSHLVFSNDTLVFNNEETKKLYISTKSPVFTEFQVISKPDWVEINPLSGTVSSSIEEIAITPKYTSLQPGVYEGALIIMTTTGKSTVYLKGIVGQRTAYTMPDTIKCSVFAQNKSFEIKNDGNIKLNYTATFSNALISMPVTMGEIPVGQGKTLSINVNRETLASGTYESRIFLNMNNKIDTILVKIENFKEQKKLLTSDVIDAEYSKSKDILVYVSSTPSKIHIFKSSLETTESIELNYVPTCVSLSPDGNTAVVGHDGHITYVNIITKTIIKEYSVSCNALDIVLGGNKWAYVFPKDDQWENIRCINVNLVTENETLQTGNYIYAGTKAKLHPSGKYIYGADNGLSPSDIEKYDIQTGTAVFLYDSPYHGDYAMGGDLWFSEDGVRVFTRGKTVLKTSETKSMDLVYNGKITLESSNARIMWLDHSSVKSNLYLISSDDDYWVSNRKNKPYVYVHNATNLVYKSKIVLEKFLVPDNNGGGNFYDAEPYFVFSNSAGDKLFVVTKAFGSGLLNEWAIQKIAIE